MVYCSRLIEAPTMISHQGFAIFFFKDATPPALYTLSLHDALPICKSDHGCHFVRVAQIDQSAIPRRWRSQVRFLPWRSEEHTSELQSHSDLVCRLLLEKKNLFRDCSKVWDGFLPLIGFSL